MRDLTIDIETRSDQDIKAVGAYRYALSPEFEILLFAYKVDEDDTKCIDLKNGEKIPEEIIQAMQDAQVVKHAYNAAFEIFCLNRAGYYTPLMQWRCTMIHAVYCGYPAGLADTGSAIGLPPEKKKMTVGAALIRYFCCPQKPTRKNGGRKYNNPQHDHDKWELFKAYNIQDVDTEHEIDIRLAPFMVPDWVWHQWHLDLILNQTGVRIDLGYVRGAAQLYDRSCFEQLEESGRISGLSNVNSPAQLKNWVTEQTGEECKSLDKAAVSDLLSRYDDGQHEALVRVLQIRQELGKSSVAKYGTMLECVADDERVRGIMQFYGANRTGRWAGRLVQLQNLPRNYLTTLDYARGLVKRGNYDGIRLLYGNVPDTLSQLIRTAFIPSDGNKFVVADYSAIEARVIAWLAQETWVQEVFATTGKIYEATAAQMFDVPVELIKKGNPEYSLRQKGKVATLALGYQGGPGSLKAMGALKQGLTEDELPDIVTRWRQANKKIVQLWWAVERAAVDTVQTYEPHETHGTIFRMEGEFIHGQTFMTVQLPSGRKLFYPRPFLSENRFGRPSLHYYGCDDKKKWRVLETYGGKLTENIVQAIARDCLAVTLERIHEAGLQVVFHVHDEVIVDCPPDAIDVDGLCNIMAIPIDWAPGLILKGAGFEGNYYMKD